MLKPVQGRIVCSIFMDSKNSHTFQDGTKIHMARTIVDGGNVKGYDNFNLRVLSPVNATVLSAEHIPQGTEILIQYNAIQDTFRVLNFTPLSGQKIADNVLYYSIPEEMAYAFYDEEDKKWWPLKNYAFGLRVFRPYTGPLVGIEPTKIKNVLYVETGELSGKVVQTITASDYQLVFQDKNNQEGNIIIFEHYEGEENDREQVVLIRDDLTKELNAGNLWVGLTKTDAKPITPTNDSKRTSRHTQRTSI